MLRKGHTRDCAPFWCTTRLLSLHDSNPIEPQSLQCPYMICNPRTPHRNDTQCLVNPAEVELHKIQGYGGPVICPFDQGCNYFGGFIGGDTIHGPTNISNKTRNDKEISEK